ncbi:MAG TPA: ATP-binding protein [Bryobacteraceae bacterium]|nr:ATP-binding protein [Bryobacteraceae bacterium]
MKDIVQEMEPERARIAAAGLFAQSLGLPAVSTVVDLVGNQEFLRFKVGRRAPVYDHALRETFKSLPDDNPFRGLLGLEVESPERFPDSMEAEVLRGLLARSTRAISGQPTLSMFPGQYVPFQNNEETQAIQPATHLIVGRRGVGKSTLILKAKQLLDRSRSVSIVLDMQPYAHRQDDDVQIDVLADLASVVSTAARQKHSLAETAAIKLDQFAGDLLAGKIKRDRASAALRRAISEVTASIDADLFVFLDDYHLVDEDQQSKIVEAIHGGLKGARGWLKVAGLRSLLRVYDPATKKGLQSPGDAQVISLDFTLVDPEAAEEHLRRILTNFLKIVGVEKLNYAVAEGAFHRLVWANAGVPRDFLQMFSKSIEHASRAGRKRVELSDANLAIGEFGQQKMTDLDEDARSEKNFVKKALDAIEKHCLENKKVNAFLIRSEATEEYRAVQTLSDLRLLHLLHQTITPHRAGERYEAYMLDYSLFTGFRRRPNIKQMMPVDGKQFKAAELRAIPILPQGFLQRRDKSLVEA